MWLALLYTTFCLFSPLLFLDSPPLHIPSLVSVVPLTCLEYSKSSCSSRALLLGVTKYRWPSPELCLVFLNGPLISSWRPLVSSILSFIPCPPGLCLCSCLWLTSYYPLWHWKGPWSDNLNKADTTVPLQASVDKAILVPESFSETESYHQKSCNLKQNVHYTGSYWVLMYLVPLTVGWLSPLWLSLTSLYTVIKVLILQNQGLCHCKLVASRHHGTTLCRFNLAKRRYAFHIRLVTMMEHTGKCKWQFHHFGLFFPDFSHATQLFKVFPLQTDF